MLNDSRPTLTVLGSMRTGYCRASSASHPASGVTVSSTRPSTSVRSPIPMWTLTSPAASSIDGASRMNRASSRASPSSFSSG